MKMTPLFLRRVYVYELVLPAWPRVGLFSLVVCGRNFSPCGRIVFVRQHFSRGTTIGLALTLVFYPPPPPLDVLRPGTVKMRGTMVIRLRTCMPMSTHTPLERFRQALIGYLGLAVSLPPLRLPATSSSRRRPWRCPGVPWLSRSVRIAIQ